MEGVCHPQDGDSDIIILRSHSENFNTAVVSHDRFEG